MYKFVIEAKELTRVAKDLSVVAAPDTKVTLRIGTRAVEDKLLCDARITGLGEQVIVQFACSKPEDWEGKAIQLISPAPQLLAEVETLLSFNADVYIKLDDKNDVFFGVEGKTEISEATIAEDVVPLKSDGYLTLFDAQEAEFTKFAKTGLLYSSSDISAASGIGNAVMSLNVESGAIVGYSTDGATLAKAEGAVAIKKPDESNTKAVEMQKKLDANLDAYIEKSNGTQSKNALKVNIPYNSVRHLLSLIDGSKAFTAAVTDKLVIVNTPTVQYTFVQGAVSPVAVEQVNGLFAAPIATKVAFDNEELTKGIGFINKIADLRKVEKPIVKLDVRNALMTASAGVSDEMKAQIKESAFDGEEKTVGLDGKRMSKVLSSLSKGVVNVRFSSAYCILSNGGIDDPDDKGQIVVFYVRINDSKAEDTSKAKEDATEEPVEEPSSETGADDGSVGGNEPAEE